MVGYNPNIDTSFMTPNIVFGSLICLVIQTIILIIKLDSPIGGVIFLSCLLFLVTFWIYVVIVAAICEIFGWDY